MNEIENKEKAKKNNSEKLQLNKKTRSRKISILKSDRDVGQLKNNDKKVEFKEFPQVIPVTSYKKYNAEIEDYKDRHKKKSRCIKCIIF